MEIVLRDEMSLNRWVPEQGQIQRIWRRALIRAQAGSVGAWLCCGTSRCEDATLRDHRRGQSWQITSDHT